MDQKRFDWIIKAIDFDKLTDWESDFIDSIERQFKRKGDLSPEQERIMEEIFERRQ